MCYKRAFCDEVWPNMAGHKSQKCHKRKSSRWAEFVATFCGQFVSRTVPGPLPDGWFFAGRFWPEMFRSRHPPKYFVARPCLDFLARTISGRSRNYWPQIRGPWPQIPPLDFGYFLAFGWSYLLYFRPVPPDRPTVCSTSSNLNQSTPQTPKTTSKI